MPARVSEDGDKLVLKLGGSKEEFADQLAKVKIIPGRRYNSTEKQWELPNDLETLLKVVHTIEPEMPAILQGKIKQAKAELQQELVTQLPDDAQLMVEWADKLTPKQRSGIDFLVEHPHSLLADDMGAGKTIEAISTVYERRIRESERTGHTIPVEPRVLVVCPNSVTGVWERELEKWGDIPSTTINGKTKAKRLGQLEESEGWTIINWEKLRLMPELAEIEWDAVIADEAHRAKNRKAKQTKALWKLKAPIQLALTGTPVMNDPGELWSILKWLRPEQYTSYWAFFYNYTDYYDGYKGKPVILGVKNADRLRFELSDKMVRRTKREIHQDIPWRLPTQMIEVDMKPKQKKLYDEATEAFWLEVAQEAVANEAAGDEGAIERVRQAMEADDLETVRLLIPTAGARMTRQRQIATSPALLGGPDESSKLDAVIETIVDGGERPFVVFAWYKDSVRLVLERLARQKISAEGFTGDTPQEDREPMAEAFQQGDFQVIVATIMSGGTGLNLYRSSDPLFVEQDWVPANNNQAIDRTDRKGQRNPVLPRFFLSRGTVDTGRIAPKNRTKELIVTSILGDDS